MMEWWDNIIFANRWALWLLLLIPVLIVCIYLLAGRGKPVLKLSSFRYLHGINTPARVKWRPVLYILRLLVLIPLIMAFARPQSRSWEHSKGQGIDIMLCIDVSKSMDALDIEPSRIEAAKVTAADFIDKRVDDRIGIVVFSGETFTLCPPTYDHRTLKSLLGTLNTGILEATGTAIGMGLAKSVERLQTSKAKSKITVLLTDGENNIGVIQPVDAARLAKTYNIRTYTIGLGGQGKAPTPAMTNPDNSVVMQYQDVDLDENTLMQMATITGGKYFRATDEKKLDEIYAEIDKMEKSEYDKSDRQQRKEEMLPFVLLAIFLLGLEFTLRYTVFDSLT